MVLELYSARKEAKEYLEFYASPDEKGKLEEYKSIIREEFYPKNGENHRHAFHLQKSRGRLQEAQTFCRCTCRADGLLYGMGNPVHL